MTSTKSSPDSDVPLDVDAVVTFLRQNPDFFADHPDLLAGLKLQHVRTGETVSLIERQVDVLREKQTAQQSQLEQLVRYANENERRQQRLMRFFVSLSALTEVSVLCQKTPVQLADAFELAHVGVKFIAERVSHVDGMTLLSSSSDGFAWLEDRLAGGHSVCDDHMPSKSSTLLLGEIADTVRSLAVVPVNNRLGRMIAIIVLGAAEHDRYQPGVDTVFLDLVGTMVSATCWRLGID